MTIKTTLMPLVAACLIGVLGSGPARAAFAEFERVPALEPNVAFWKRVYIEWSVNSIAFHDEEDLGTVYRVVTVPGRGEKDARGRTRQDVVRAAREEVQAALRALARTNPGSDAGLHGVEKEVYNNLKDVARADKYGRIDGVRAQNGLRERFLQGWANSGLYQDFIEAELKRNSLPPELIGVAFVESLFFVGARSKVGAAGVWQFMSYTGREYMHLNALVDERYDPMLATEAAAKYLRQAKKELGTWPLAVTSYNYGRGGMKQLANGAGTTDFGVILAVSKGKRFGFAARNYYASFLAVLDILKDKETLLKGHERKPAWAYDVIRLPYAAFSTQLAQAGIDGRTLDVLNPAITVEARDGRVPFPHGFAVRVPSGRGAEVLAKLASLPEAERQRAARAVRAVHKATGKQSVADIARKYGVASQTLAASLGLDANARPAKGKLVPVPHAGVRFTLLPEARAVPAPAVPAPVQVLMADATVPVEADTPAQVLTARASAASSPKEVAVVATSVAVASAFPKGKVVLGPVRASKVERELPAVDVIAGSGAVMLPAVDAIAGAPAADAPWMALEEPPAIGQPST